MKQIEFNEETKRKVNDLKLQIIATEQQIFHLNQQETCCSKGGKPQRFQRGETSKANKGTEL